MAYKTIATHVPNSTTELHTHQHSDREIHCLSMMHHHNIYHTATLVHSHQCSLHNAAQMGHDMARGPHFTLPLPLGFCELLPLPVLLDLVASFFHFNAGEFFVTVWPRILPKWQFGATTTQYTSHFDTRITALRGAPAEITSRRQRLLPILLDKSKNTLKAW